MFSRTNILLTITITLHRPNKAECIPIQIITNYIKPFGNSSHSIIIDIRCALFAKNYCEQIMITLTASKNDYFRNLYSLLIFIPNALVNL